MNSLKNKVRKIVSGGQTGVDRAALDFALENDIEIGGWIPRNRWAEDGRIPDKYPNLRETESENSAERTELNVRDSDATLILSHGALVGGSNLTLELAKKHAKPHLHLDFNELSEAEAVKEARNWIAENSPLTLNIAGARHSEDSKIYERVKSFLHLLFPN